MPNYSMGFSGWVTGFQQELAAGTCFGGTIWDCCVQFPKEGWGVLVEQLASLQLGVSGCISSFLGCECLRSECFGPHCLRTAERCSARKGANTKHPPCVLLKTCYILDKSVTFTKIF